MGEALAATRARIVRSQRSAILNQPTAYLRCIETNCDAHHAISERLYTCPRCGGLLDVQYDFDLPYNAAELKTIFKDRRATGGPLDRSGVWRFRELLPFVENLSQVVTLEEGNTPIYDAPRSAKYAGLGGLHFKYQGMKPTGSFND